MRNIDTVELHVDDRLLSREHTTYTRPMSTDSAHRINRSPQNTKLIHRSSMNYVIGGNQKKTPPILPPSGGLDETDGAAGDALLIEGVCSKSSITSASSTSKFLTLTCMYRKQSIQRTSLLHTYSRPAFQCCKLIKLGCAWE